MRRLFIVAGILAGCAASPMDSGTMTNAQDYMPPIPAGAQAETVRRIALQPDGSPAELSISGIHSQQRQVIQDQAAWRAAWDAIFANQGMEPELPAVDFSKETVLLAAMGDSTNGGSIVIDGAFAAPDGTTAGVSSTSLDSMCMMGMMSQVMMQPVDVVAVPKASAVTFAERGAMTMCSGGMPMGMNR